MKMRRRRLFREDTVAPWVTLAVILGLWWLGAQILGINPAQSVLPSSPPPAAGTATADPRTSSGTDAAVVRPTNGSAAAPSDRAEPAPEHADFASPQPAAPQTMHGDDLDALRHKGLIVPVAGVPPSALQPTYDEARGNGARRHEALDILAARGTPVLAAVDGRVAKLFTSAAGGLTVYQFDAEERFCYYYAHLDSYSDGLEEGTLLRQGQPIGTVGTTGNAPPGAPHLHFAINRLGPDKKWWEGEPLDPYLVLREVRDIMR